MIVSKRGNSIQEEPFFIALNLPPDVLRLTAGEPDFPSASFVNEAAFKAATEGKTHYTTSGGIAPLREAISAKLKEENNLSYDPDEIVVTPGSSAGILLALFAAIDPGDEVLIPDPAWFHYPTLVELAGGIPIRIPLDPGDGFRLRAAAIEGHVTAKSRLLIVNNPSNPCGTVASGSELEEVASAAERHDLTVISDEIYEKIVYPPGIHKSMAAVSGARERTVVTNGFSKGYAMMGWRVGFVAAPRELTRKLDPLLGYSLVCASGISQYAALEALRNPKSKEYAKKMVDAWKRRREMVLEQVSQYNDVMSTKPPEGTFYAWINVSGSGMDGKEAARRALEEVKVGVMPGYLFGERGKDYVRVSFATSDSTIQTGMERFSQLLRGGKEARGRGDVVEGKILQRGIRG